MASAADFSPFQQEAPEAGYEKPPITATSRLLPPAGLRASGLKHGDRGETTVFGSSPRGLQIPKRHRRVHSEYSGTQKVSSDTKQQGVIPIQAKIHPCSPSHWKES